MRCKSTSYTVFGLYKEQRINKIFSKCETHNSPLGDFRVYQLRFEVRWPLPLLRSTRILIYGPFPEAQQPAPLLKHTRTETLQGSSVDSVRPLQTGKDSSQVSL